MKKLIALLLALIFVFSMVGCGTTSSTTTTTDDDTDTSATDTADEGDAEDVADEADEADATEAEEETPAANEVSFESTTIVDNDAVAITVESYDEATCTFTICVENKRDDATLTCMFTKTALNGVMYGNNCWSETVDAGLTTCSTVDFSDMADYGVNYIESVQTHLFVYNENNIVESSAYNGTVAFTVSNTTEDASTFDLTADTEFENIELCDENGVKVTVFDYDPDTDNGPTLYIAIENSTDLTLMTYIDPSTLEGDMISPYWTREIYPGATCYAVLNFSTEELEARGVTELEGINAQFCAYDADDWFCESLVFFDTTIDLT